MLERGTHHGEKRRVEFGVFNASMIEKLRADGILSMVGGGYAVDEHTDIYRIKHKDLDIFATVQDVPAILQAARAIGHTTEVVFPHWLAKIYDHGQTNKFIDVICATGNGLVQIDSTWYDRAPTATIGGQEVRIPPVEEFIAMMASVKNWDRFYGPDINKIIQAQGKTLDWHRLLNIFGDEDWPILETHLIDFDYIFPSDRDNIPFWVREELIRRRIELLQTPQPAQRESRGRLYSPTEYEHFFDTSTHIPSRGLIWKRQ